MCPQEMPVNSWSFTGLCVASEFLLEFIMLMVPRAGIEPARHFRGTGF